MATEQEWPRLAALLDRFLGLPDDELAGALAVLPAEDRPLRARLEAALAAARGGEGGRWDRPAAESWPELLDADGPAGAGPAGPVAGGWIGRWRLGDELGRGGMATVYAAERADGAYRQRAALKLLRLGLDEPGLRARFLHERQILARLEHPAIARLLDGGIAPDGCPYLVLERVDGVPITEHCDRRRAGLEERIRLFLAVLEAVDYAQRNLMVHRDLKPSNVLVEAGGGPKLLDFGVAKLLAGDGDLELTRTRAGVPLTPQYAAPEQVLGGAVTTATDVYALGLLLYELLAGVRPYRLSSESALELERRIVEGAVPPPSQSALAAGPEAAARRGTTPAQLARRLRGDLDAIVLRALAKEPERRYPSAGALSRDLESFLAGRPVEARPDELGYRARKFARRHRAAVGLGIAVLVLLLAGLAAFAFALTQARARLAETQRAETIRAFLLDLFAGVDPEQARGREISAREVLDAGAARLEREGAGAAPATRVELLATLGSLYVDLGEYERAEPLLRQALELGEERLGDASPEVGGVLLQLAHLLYWQDRYTDAMPLLERALEIFRSAPGGRRAETANVLAALGTTLRQLGRYEEAAERHRQALAVEREIYPGDALEIAETAGSLALSLRDAGRDREALPLAEEATRIRRARLAADHPGVADALAVQGLVLGGLGRYADAEPLVREALAVRLQVFGPEHPKVLETRNDLANLLQAAGRLDEALVVARESIGTARRIYPSDSPCSPFTRTTSRPSASGTATWNAPTRGSPPRCTSGAPPSASAIHTSPRRSTTSV